MSVKLDLQKKCWVRSMGSSLLTLLSQRYSWNGVECFKLLEKSGGQVIAGAYSLIVVVSELPAEEFWLSSLGGAILVRTDGGVALTLFGEAGLFLDWWCWSAKLHWSDCSYTYLVVWLKATYEKKVVKRQKYLRNQGALAFDKLSIFICFFFLSY